MSLYNTPPPPPVSKRYERPSEDITLDVVRDIRRLVRLHEHVHIDLGAVAQQIADDVMYLRGAVEDIGASVERLANPVMVAEAAGHASDEDIEDRWRKMMCLPRRLTASELKAVERGFYQVEVVKPRAMWAAGEADGSEGIVPAGIKPPGPVIPHG